MILYAEIYNKGSCHYYHKDYDSTALKLNLYSMKNCVYQGQLVVVSQQEGSDFEPTWNIFRWCFSKFILIMCGFPPTVQTAFKRMHVHVVCYVNTGHLHVGCMLTMTFQWALISGLSGENRNRLKPRWQTATMYVLPIMGHWMCQRNWRMYTLR